MQKFSAGNAMNHCFLMVAVCCVINTLAPDTATAQPAKGTSAYKAARLKNHPPKNWIRHYLGDDRYKIAGGVWKVVSTELDRYYYPAWAPEMLRQPAGIVIGFSSAAEAEEAGYTASSYPMGNPLAGLSAAEIADARRRDTRQGDTINRSSSPIRITLADGKSTVLLPPNWRRTRTGTETVLGYALQSDTLQPLSGGGTLRFAFINAPGNVNIEPFLTTQRFPQLVQLATKPGKASTPAAKFLQNSTVSTGRLGGRNGITLTPTTANPTMPARVTIVASGAKAYLLESSSKATNSAIVVNSFKPG